MLPDHHDRVQVIARSQRIAQYVLDRPAHHTIDDQEITGGYPRVMEAVSAQGMALQEKHPYPFPGRQPATAAVHPSVTREAGVSADLAPLDR